VYGPQSTNGEHLRHHRCSVCASFHKLINSREAVESLPLVLRSKQGGCDFSGSGCGGFARPAAADGLYNAETGIDVTLTQEPGHNFGMQHSSALKCGGQTFVDVPNGTCTMTRMATRSIPWEVGAVI